MSKPFGKCALCRRTAELQDSHLIPRALYSYIKDEITEKSHPLCVSGERAFLSAKQYTKHLLCFNCEQLFHRHGEDWTLKQIHKGNGRFTLLDNLKSGISSSKYPHTIAHPVATCPSLRIEKLLYFAISIFWRYSVTEWHLGDGESGTLSLGKVYEETFRHFLLQPSEVLENTVLIVRVFGPEVTFSNSILLPHGGCLNGFHAHRLIIPGIQFELAVGKRIPAELRHCATSRDGYIYLTHLPDHVIDIAAPTLRTTTLLGKAAREQ